MDNFALHQILVPEKSKEKGGNAQYPIFYITRTLICPVDYDGAVFKFGYTSPELSEQSGKIDFEARVYKVDELPYNGDDYLYFTLTDD